MSGDRLTAVQVRAALQVAARRAGGRMVEGFELEPTAVDPYVDREAVNGEVQAIAAAVRGGRVLPEPAVRVLRWSVAFAGGHRVKGLSRESAPEVAERLGGRVEVSWVDVFADGLEVLHPWRPAGSPGVMAPPVRLWRSG